MAIWWIRRDLRLADNQALTAALAENSGLVPVFILDEALLRQPAARRQAFLFSGLRTLEKDLQARGSGLILRRGDPLQELPRLVRELDGARVYAEEDVSPYARKRDGELQKKLDLRLTQGVSTQPIGAVLRADGNPYTVFTPFSKVWKALPFPGGTISAPPQLPLLPDLPSEPLPTASEVPGFPAGEGEAQRRLQAFVEGAIYAYTDERNRMDREGTSGLSPYLRFGMLSARQAAYSADIARQAAAKPADRAGAETWLNELIWREFYQAILFHFPDVLRQPFLPAAEKIAWRHAPADLQAWKDGQTGYPVVDAGMRQLRETGWMHNRARMIVASFLVKHLLINWQEGERWFMEMLVDGDPASNNGGWQWTAGTGTDAAPYFRVFNPFLQGQKFDPQGLYVRRWVPELAEVPESYIHTPWEMPTEVQQAAGVRIGSDYPAPIVEHRFARERVLAAYQQAFKS